MTHDRAHPIPKAHLVLSFVVIALAACAPVRISDTGPLPPAIQLGEPLPIAPGDVVYMTTFIPGVPKITNRFPPQIQTNRFVFRKIGMNQRLTASETALLGSLFAAHIKGPLPDDTQPLLTELDDKASTLWNALINSLVILRSEKTFVVHFNIAQKSNGSRDENDWTICKVVSNSAELTKNYLLGCDEKAPSRDTRNIGPVGKPLSPVTATSVEQVNPIFYASKVAASEVVDVELASASMSRRDGEESRWSLAEWEASEVCTDRLRPDLHWKISSIKLRQGRLLFVRDEGAGVDIRLTPYNGAPANGVLRSKLITAPPDTHYATTIRSASLSYLYPSDVEHVSWAANGRVHTTVRLPRSVQERCSPR